MNKHLLKESMSTPLITIGWQEKMEVAYHRMLSHRVRHLPVMNDEQEVIGMLSDRDVQRSMVSQVEKPTAFLPSDEKIQFDEESLVRDYMSWPVKSVGLKTDLRLVAERMILEKLSSLVVCDGDKAIGIITAEDMMRVLIRLLSDPQTPKRWTMETLLSGVMTETPVSI